MRWALLVMVACGGSSKKPAEAKVEQPVANACVPAYAEYETRWRAARSEDLKEVNFDAASIDQMFDSEVALLPKRTDLEKLRAMYAAIALFVPDAPWPAALDAADAAIAQCGEGAAKP